ncbi:MAG: septum formation initiator family protein [Thiothrix sp.]|nr:septum formation initiator family protein [Thiothrix sp.]HPE60546.1 septum formation initiator family protein [Thiolinea sp.]
MNITRLLFILASLLVLALFLRLWFGSGSLPSIWELKAHIAQQQQQNEEQLDRNRQLESDVSEINRDTEAIEDHARSELGMVKRDETFYQVILRSEQRPSSVVILPEQAGKQPHVE